MLCAMIYRMYSDDFELSEKTCGFADFDDVSAYAKDAVAALAASGVINGMGDNRFQPKTSRNPRNACANYITVNFKGQNLI